METPKGNENAKIVRPLSPSLDTQKKSESRAVEREQQERVEALAQIEEGLAILAHDQPLLKVRDLFVQLKKLPTPTLTNFAEIIFGIYDVTPKGARTFNQLVKDNKTNEVILRISSGLHLLSRCRDSYNAPMEVLDAALVSLQNMDSAPLISLIQAKPSILRASLRLDGEFYTWDTAGTLSRPVRPTSDEPEKSISAKVGESTHMMNEVEKDAFEGADFDDAETDSIDERLAHYQRLLMDADLTEEGPQYLTTDEAIVAMQNYAANSEAFWQGTDQNEYDKGIAMSPDEFRSYLAYHALPRLAETYPEQFMNFGN